MGISIPTSARFMTESEYQIVEGVFGDTLPWRRRIIVTNGAGVDNRAFTIPTSLVRVLLGAAATGFLAPITAAIGSLTTFINLGYLMNVGDAYDDFGTNHKGLLVHETTHVWQGKNSTLALSYVFNSCLNQCISGSGAYAYTPGKEWSSYNVEQQASIVEHWYVNGSQTSDSLFPYIRDHVREGDA